MSDNIGQRLKTARIKANITQQVAADYLGICRTTLSDMEKGNRRIRIGELRSLSNLYGVDVLNDQYPDEGIGIEYTPKNKDEVIARDTLLSLFMASIKLERKLKVPLKHSYMGEEIFLHVNGQQKLATQAEDLAMKVRNKLGIGLKPIHNIMEYIQNELNIRLFIHPLPPDISGMFTYHPKLAACIVINANLDVDKQMISAARELTFFFIRREYTNISSIYEEEEDDVYTKFSRLFAIAFLMPATWIRNFYREAVVNHGKFAAQDVLILMEDLNLRLVTVLGRLNELDIITMRTIYTDYTEAVKNECLLKYPRWLLLAATAYQKELFSKEQLCDMFLLNNEDLSKLLDLTRMFREIDELM